MGEITALTAQKKNQKRINLFVDGKFLVGFDLETLVKEGLEVGDVINEEEQKRLIKISGHQKILEKVFRILSYRPRSKKEIRDFLRRKKIDEEEIKKVIEQLEKNNYLNDEEFARWWIEQRMSFKPAGKKLLKLELFQKGIDKEMVDSLFQDLSFSKEEKKLAKRAAEKKIRTLKSLPEKNLKEKLTNFLLRRGFDWAIVKEVIADF